MKYSSLVSFCEELLIKRNYNRDIGFHTLEHEIAKYFDCFSKYKLENIKKALLDYKFIERLGMADRYSIIYGLKQKTAEDIAKEEANDLLSKFDGVEDG